MVVAPNLLQLYGSVIPRALPWAVIGCTLGVVVKWANNNFDGIVFARHFSDGGVFYHPYSLHVLGMVLGFSLVMRIQIAYQRFWEGAGQCHQAIAKWGDAVMQVRTLTTHISSLAPLSALTPLSTLTLAGLRLRRGIERRLLGGGDRVPHAHITLCVPNDGVRSY